MNSNAGVLKLVAVLAVLLLAGLALLLVLDLLPREQFTELSIKALLSAGIIGAASLVIGLLSKGSGTDRK